MQIHTLKVETDLPMNVPQVREWFEAALGEVDGYNPEDMVRKAIDITRKRIGAAAGVSGNDTQEEADAKVAAWVAEQPHSDDHTEHAVHPDHRKAVEMLDDVRDLLNEQRKMARMMKESGVTPPLVLLNQTATLSALFDDLQEVLTMKQSAGRADAMAAVLAGFAQLTRQPRYSGGAMALLLAAASTDGFDTEMAKVEHELHQLRGMATTEQEKADVRKALASLTGHKTIESWSEEQERQREQAIRVNKLVADALRNVVTVN